MRTKKILSLLLCGAFCAGTSAAQETAAPAEDRGETAETFSEAIVVTATRDERALDQLPVSVTVLGAEEIQTTPATSLDDALRSVAGVNLPLEDGAVSSPFTSFVSMRGLGGARALVLVDGQPLNDSFFGFVPWDRSPLEDVGQVEVVRGGGSSLFGSYAMGGVINILTRPISGRDLQVRAMGGSDGTYRLNAYGSEMLTGRLGVSASVNRFDTDGYIALEPAARGAIDVPARSETTNVQLKAEYQATPSLRWSARVSAFEREGRGGTRLSRDNREATSFALGADWRVGGGELGASLFYEDEELRTDNVDVPFFSGRDFEYVSNAHVTPVKDFGASAVWSRKLGPRFRSLVAGVDLRRVEGEDRARNFDEDGRLYLTEVGGGRQTSAGLFFETSLFPVDSLELLFSARYDRWENAEGRRRTDPGRLEAFPIREESQVSPRLSARWQASPNLALRAAAYRAFRAPNLDELYRSSSLTGSALVANPLLDPETLEGHEAGLDLLFGSVRGQVNVFRNDLEDEITFVAAAFFPVFVLEVQNVGESRSQGAEAILEAALGRGFRLDASYTWTETEVLANPANPALVGKERVGVPRDYAALSLRYVHPAAGWTAGARGRYSGKRYTDLFNSRTLEAHRVFDLSLSIPLGTHFEVFGIAENVLGEEYGISDFGGRILGAPRQVFGGVRYRLR